MSPSCSTDTSIETQCDVFQAARMAAAEEAADREKEKQQHAAEEAKRREQRREIAAVLTVQPTDSPSVRA